MNKQLELQKQFQLLAGQTRFGINETPDIETRVLRLKLALEELCELAEAFGLEDTFSSLLQSKIKDVYDKIVIDTHVYNQKEALDGLLDIAVINNGTIITCGFEEIFDREYENVDTNNKTKFHTDIDEALKTQDYYMSGHVKTTIEKVTVDNVIFYVVKNIAGKVLKPYNYKQVKLNLNK